MFRLLLASALCLSSSLSFAAGDDDTLGSSDCKVHNPYGKRANRVVWSGECKDGFAHGSGNLDFDIKKLHGGRYPVSRYEGMVEAGRMHGQGKLVHANGSTYTGSFRAGDYDGRGAYKSMHYTYEGEWKADRPHGVGKIVYALGGSYEGEWLNGEFHGKGVALYAGGRRVEGEFINGIRLGAAPRPEADNSLRYTNASNEPVKGRWVWENAWSQGVPHNLGYHELTPGQRQLVRNAYPMLDDTDEPPYPANGITNIMHKLGNLGVPVEGTLRLDIRIDKNGTPASVKLYPFASAAVARAAAYILMSEKYKPALCHGQPCEMDYTFSITYEDQ